MSGHVDLICIGAGLAGLTAAVRASELGLKTLVLEQGSDADYACNSRHCYGILHAAHQDLTRPADELATAIERTMGRRSPLAQAVADDGRRLIPWLREQGGKLVHAPKGLWTMAPIKPRVTHVVWQGLGPDVMLRALLDRLARRGGEIRYATRATALLDRGGACGGVVATTRPGELAIPSRFVLIADGGFQGNPSLLRRHVSPHPEALLPRHAGTGRGDGLSMALALGAAGVDLDSFYGHLLSADALHRSDLWPYPQIDAIASAGLLVDASGRRRLDEGKGGVYLANGMARTPGLGRATVICDAAIWSTAGRQHQIPPNPLLERHGATVHRAATLAELAALSGLPEQALCRTVADYNAALHSDSLHRLDPPRTRGIEPMALRVPPFMAIPVCAGITNTAGGIAIDDRGRVLDTRGRAIAGLYAAGAATGGLDGGPDAGYVGGLVKAVFGLRAAEDMARERVCQAAALV